MSTHRSPASSREELEALGEAVHAAVREVLVEAARGDWNEASRRVLALVHATRRLETEVDFNYMSEWLAKAQHGGDGPSEVR